MRYTGSEFKRARRVGISIREDGKELRKRANQPGQHGAARKRKQSEYGRQLTEKQKLRFIYGVNERQFRRLFTLALKSDEVTGLAFMQILESRLDNLVFRLGFARTRRGARQLVNHGHIEVNGKKTDIPSYLCKVNDVISVRENSLNQKSIKESLESFDHTIGFVDVDRAKMSGRFLRKPERNELNKDINEAQIIEYYNRLL